MSEHVQGTSDIGFIPAIFDENETDFIMQSIGIAGYKYKDQVDAIPAVLEGEKLEVQTQAMAGFVVSCLLRRAELATNLLAQHKRGYELVNEHIRRMPSREHQANIRNSMERCQQVAELSGQLISRLSFTATEVE